MKQLWDFPERRESFTWRSAQVKTKEGVSFFSLNYRGKIIISKNKTLKSSGRRKNIKDRNKLICLV